MSGKYGVGASRRGRAVDNATGSPHKNESHHKEGCGPPSRATDAEIRAIRTRQAYGEHWSHVYSDYRHIGEHSFRNIWEGITRAYILHDK